MKKWQPRKPCTTCPTPPSNQLPPSPHLSITLPSGLQWTTLRPGRTLLASLTIKIHYPEQCLICSKDSEKACWEGKWDEWKPGPWVLVQAVQCVLFKPLEFGCALLVNYQRNNKVLCELQNSSAEIPLGSIMSQNPDLDWKKNLKEVVGNWLIPSVTRLWKTAVCGGKWQWCCLLSHQLWCASKLSCLSALPKKDRGLQRAG